jgi:hypothetical protein
MIRWLIIFLTVSSTAFCQQLIEGRIVDKETGKPIPFASIGIVGTSKGTSSNLNGQFSLSVSEAGSLRITCIGYESLTIESFSEITQIQLRPIATQLAEVVVFNKPINPRRIVWRAFANIPTNYIDQPYLQKFFYRHYCKDDSVYGRLIEAAVDVWKHGKYSSLEKTGNDKKGIRVTQLRRSLDNTIMAQAHEPIAVENILHADVVSYQMSEKSTHLSFYTDVSNLKTDIDNYSFTFNGITNYDGEEVYKIGYSYRKDSAATTSGKYIQLTQISGSLFIDPDSYAIVKMEDVKAYGENTLHTSAYYRKYNDKYYPYHLIREGENHLAENRVHSFHIDLMSVEILTDKKEKFVGHEPSKDELLSIPYDTAFWNRNTVLKTTPLEDEIVRDLGGGASLNDQFYQYHQYETNVHDGGKNGEEKFNWFREDSKGKRILYLFFLAKNCQSYLNDVELAKRLNKQYRGKIAFVFLDVEDDEILWQQTISKFNLTADGIINYRIGSNSDVLKSLSVKNTPSFILISRNGELFDVNAKHPGNPQLEEDFKALIGHQE